MSKRIDRVDVRTRLPLRRDPYWLRVSKGQFIGFRYMTKGTPGTWLARLYDGAGYTHKSLGEFATLPEKERYDAAKKEAEKWFQHVDMGGSTAPCSVKAACEAYLEKLRNEKSERAAKDTEGYFTRLVYKDPLAKLQLSKLTKPHMLAWRERVLRHNGNHSSFNRNVTALRAALNLARKHGQVATDQAWLSVLEPFKNVGEPRELYLDRAARARLIENASSEARPFFKTLNMLPMRPGGPAALRVENFRLQERALKIPHGKTKTLTIPLTNAAVAHFKECAKGKLPSAWLVSRADGSQWKKEAWRDEIKAAARKAKLPKATVAYTLRHSVITDLIVGGLDIFTVAKVSGTSVKMIEQTYGHLQQEHARSALEKLAMG